MKLCTEHSMPCCRTCSKDPDPRIDIPGSTLKKNPEKGMKKSGKRRPMSSQQMGDLVQRVMLRDGRCVACDFDDAMCDGQTDAAHLIPQRELKKHYPAGHGIFEDERNAVALCRSHHGLMDGGFLRLPDEVLPIGFWAFLREFGFEASWDAAKLKRVA